MPKQDLRIYQTDCHAAVFDALIEGYKSVLYTMATGCGKTTTAAEIIRTFLETFGWKGLCVVHRREIVRQIYTRVRDHCDLDEEYEIGIEQAEEKGLPTNRVIVANIATLRSESRLPPGWIPDFIWIDEAHRSAAATYKAIRARFPNAVVIGCTATAKRTDKQSLFAIGVDGQPAMVKPARGPAYPATAEDSVFEKLCYEYSMLDAINDGWLVDMVGREDDTGVDLSGVASANGDFVDKQLVAALEKEEVMLRRTDKAISLWSRHAADRPTIVFCPGVKSAKFAADHWKEAGYTAAFLCGETDNVERAMALEDFKQGRVQVLANVGLFTEGTDLPTCSCIVHLRPTKSWNLYVQMSGRASRSVIADALSQMDDPAERREAIKASAKPTALIIDMVDIVTNGTLCTVPSILDLPVNLDLEGQSVTAAKKMLDEFEEVKGQVIGEAPRTFTRLEGRLREVQLLTRSGAKSRQKWMVSEDGNYQFGKAPPGYTAQITRDGEEWRLTVKCRGEELYAKTGHQRGDVKEYFDRAAEVVSKQIETHREANKGGTLDRLSSKQVFILTRNGHKKEEIDKMQMGYAKKLIGDYSREYYARRESQMGLGI